MVKGILYKDFLELEIEMETILSKFVTSYSNSPRYLFTLLKRKSWDWFDAFHSILKLKSRHKTNSAHSLHLTEQILQGNKNIFSFRWGNPIIFLLLLQFSDDLSVIFLERETSYWSVTSSHGNLIENEGSYTTNYKMESWLGIWK